MGEQERTEHGTIWQEGYDRIKYTMVEQDRTGQGRRGEERTEHYMTGQDREEDNMGGQDKIEQDRT